MQAVILAAGMGKRLKDLTKNNTKCMVEVNGVSLIDRMLHQIDSKNMSRIVIVVGYEGEKLKEYIATLGIRTPIEYVDNPIYDKTNNIYSLALAKDYLTQDDTILFESDLIFENAIIDALLDDERDTLALVDKYESWMDGTCVKLNSDDSIEKFVPGKKFKFEERNEYYKTVNLYKFSKDFSETHYVPFLEAYSQALGNNEYYEQVLRVITMLDEPVIKAKRLSGEKWYEIDDVQDLDIASTIFTPDESEKLSLMEQRCGGYWRYPKMIDFVHATNPYYPSEKMINEIKASFDNLVRQYPSDININSLLASKNYSIKQSNILVGNGSSEIINVLMNQLEGKVGFIEPAFEEYLNRYDKEKSIKFTPNNDFSYTYQDIIDYYSTNEVSNIVVVNPDKHTGKYINNQDMLSLIEWCKTKDINIIVDETYADFASEEKTSLIEQETIDKYSNLYIIKSLSTSYGIPGLRLGIFVSSDVKMIEDIKKEESIWNINSFAEFYLQIAEKFSRDFKDSIQMIKDEKERFEKEISGISGITLIPSETNYCLLKLNKNVSKDIAGKLFDKYSILVRDMTGKIQDGEYIRVAIKNSEENDKLLNALKEVL